MAMTAQLNVTPDGFCHHADVVVDDAFMEFAVRCLEESDCLLLGRKTYDLFRDHWPRAAQDAGLPPWETRLARNIDDIDKMVVSRSMTGSVWQPTSIIVDLNEDTARSISATRRTIVLGSPSVIFQLARWGVLDQLMLTVHPVMGREGVRAFAGPAPATMKFEHDFPTGASRTYVFVSGRT